MRESREVGHAGPIYFRNKYNPIKSNITHLRFKAHVPGTMQIQTRTCIHSKHTILNLWYLKITQLKLQNIYIVKYLKPDFNSIKNRIIIEQKSETCNHQIAINKNDKSYVNNPRL